MVAIPLFHTKARTMMESLSTRDRVLNCFMKIKMKTHAPGSVIYISDPKTPNVEGVPRRNPHRLTLPTLRDVGDIVNLQNSVGTVDRVSLQGGVRK